MSNRITIENQLLGNDRTEWDIINEGVWTIEGFATDISYVPGQTVDFKIRTVATNYRIDLYRLGYYNGLGARKVHTVQVQRTTAQVQSPPNRDVQTGLIDAGNWDVSASWTIPSTAVSGIYLAKLVRQDGVAGQNHIPLIVRDDAGNSDIVFQTSDTTWQAYNSWGGVSLYGGNGPGTDPATAGRAYKVSYNRPFETRWGDFYAGAQDWIFGVEHPALMWIEQNGYDVSYISGVDSARSGYLLTSHKIFLSVGHDEYWSGEQRANVEAARDQGLHLAFLSGNEVYWRTRWEPSMGPSPVPYRTLVCYKETRAKADIDPSGQWTGTYRDPRFAGPNAIGAGRPENRLTGTIFTVDSYRLDAMTIPSAYSQMRFWRNTSVAALLPGQTAILPAGYLGYEWDSDLDNGFRPPGLINMSQTVLTVSTLLLDYGSTTGTGVAEHNLTLYKAPSGALVFGAGTVYWAWALNSNHDLEAAPEDLRVQQAMVNLFADMEVQPASLVFPLVPAIASTDTTPPVSSITPPLGTLPFSQSYTIMGTATDVGGVVGGVEVSTNDGTTWHKAQGRENWTYSWTPSIGGTYIVRSRAVDDSGNIESPGPGVVFNVAGPIGVTLYAQDDKPLPLPADDPSSVELGLKFIPMVSGSVLGVRFYKVPTNVGAHSGTLWNAAGSEMATTIFANETASGWQTALFASPVSVTAGQTYVISYHSNGFYGANDYSFMSDVLRAPLLAPASATSGGNGVYALGPDRVFPTQTFNATNYWVDVLFQPPSTVPTPPVAVDDGPLLAYRDTPLVIGTAALLANDTDANGNPLSVTSVSAAFNGTVVLDSGNGTVTFTPTASFTGSAQFTYTITDGQNGFASANVSIMVRQRASGSGVFAANAVPATITVNDNSPVELGLKFTPSVSGTITGIRFYKGPQNTGAHSARLWTLAGTEMGSLTFADETATGWQVGTFIDPLPVIAGTTYLVSYHTSGFYSADANAFTSAVTNGSLTAPASATSGGNGVFKYGVPGSFPNASFNATNYWIDVLFQPASGTPPPVAQNDSGFTTPINTSVVINAAALLANDSDPLGNGLTITSVSAPAFGSVVLNSNATVTFTPTSGFAGNASFAYTISDGLGRLATANVSLTVVAPLTGSGVLAANAVPDTVTVNDPSPVELGMKFTAAVNGTVRGARFYKGAQNVGTHTATLWDAQGTALQSSTFTHETASGWQSTAFVPPAAIVAGQTYVISYHTNGYYSASTQAFASAVTNGSLTAPSSASVSGNGVFHYGATAFPTGSFNATNYFIDVYFEG